MASERTCYLKKGVKLTGAERIFVHFFYIEWIVLPRQAWDKHKESTQTEETRFLIETHASQFALATVGADARL